MINCIWCNVSSLKYRFLYSCERACERSEQTTGEALVYIINKIRMSVRPSVRLSVYLRLLIGARYVGKLYMVRSEISTGRFLSMFRREPTTLPDATVRKLEFGRKNARESHSNLRVSQIKIFVDVQFKGFLFMSTI